MTARPAGRTPRQARVEGGELEFGISEETASHLDRDKTRQDPSFQRETLPVAVTRHLMALLQNLPQSAHSGRKRLSSVVEITPQQ